MNSLIRALLFAGVMFFCTSLDKVSQQPIQKPVVVDPFITYQDTYRLHQVECLAHAIYFEARGETIKGELAVGQVTIHRAKSAEFPDNVCDVVHQKLHGRCQYTWVCRKRMHVRDQQSYDEIQVIAGLLYDYYDVIPEIVPNALYYQKGRPTATNLIIVAHIDHQFFYRYANT